MSSYFRNAKHPLTGAVENAMWVDDAYGQHRYGVVFPDGSMYPEQDIEAIEETGDGTFVPSSMPALHPLGDTPLRTEHSIQRYKNFRATCTSLDCIFCRERTFEAARYLWWQIIPNDFPYDAVASAHDMLVPLRHFANPEDMTILEQMELNDIRFSLEIENKYDAIIENLPRGRTIPAHYHLHLVTWRRI